jgi:hypothetical protein
MAHCRKAEKIANGVNEASRQPIVEAKEMRGAFTPRTVFSKES